jgi:nitroreductase
MEALQQRASSREFSDKEVSDAVLSQVLWAACGINRPGEKKITAPSAINAQDILVYVARKDGADLYQPETNTLKKVCDEDVRKMVAGQQEFAATAPISLILVSDKTKFGDRSSGADLMGNIDSGYVSENICLVCTALGLKTVPRMSMDKEALAKALKLTDSQVLLLNNPIGW